MEILESTSLVQFEKNTLFLIQRLSQELFYVQSSVRIMELSMVEAATVQMDSLEPDVKLTLTTVMELPVRMVELVKMGLTVTLAPV